MKNRNITQVVQLWDKHSQNWSELSLARKNKKKILHSYFTNALFCLYSNITKLQSNKKSNQAFSIDIFLWWKVSNIIFLCSINRFYLKIAHHRNIYCIFVFIFLHVHKTCDFAVLHPIKKIYIYTELIVGMLLRCLMNLN